MNPASGLFQRRSGTEKRIALQSQDSGPNHTVFGAEQCERVVPLPPLVGRASGVEEQEIVFVFQERHVRVAEDDHAGLGEMPFQAVAAAFLASGVVDHGHPHTAQIELEGLGEFCLRRIKVARDGANGSIKSEFVEEGWIHQVPRVQQQVGLVQIWDDLFRKSAGAARYMRVGEDDGQGAQWPAQKSSKISLNKPLPW